MKILSIGEKIIFNGVSITSIYQLDDLTIKKILTYNYIIIHGGDGAIRRVLKELKYIENLPPFILNPTGSFNVIAKLHRVSSLNKIMQEILENREISTKRQNIYRLNDEIFLFSAGNMGDLQHIFLSETLRFGVLKKGILKYLLSFIALLPLHIIITPFMLLSKRRFFIFTPFKLIKKFASFYGVVENIEIDLQNSYNFIELDGDIITTTESILKIELINSIQIVA